MEAMVLRRPVITTAVAGIPELVRNGESGWLVAAGSIDELTEAMANCLSTPATQLAAMGHAARARALQRHSIDTEASKLARHFMEAMT
jgi:colanic acid/amylovoran biosynthesis glycosyltransferase